MVELVIVGVASVTVMENACEVEPPEFVAVTVKLEVPRAVGYPLTTPLAEPSAKPAGKLPALIPKTTFSPV
jgi:hypothetical protein